ncbi:MAG TPA: AAA family ATPase [Myxococcota bacterium]|jgi:class 3 adenylate cyclase/tetratricopeptide (TPR) repeat protein
MICSVCAHANPHGARFCNRCGAPARGDGEPRGERRQLTLMFCDLVGSARLAEQVDPEELRELLGRYHTVCAETIARYEGYVAQYLGDGILAYFGYPTAHEDDAERAIRSALEIQLRLGQSAVPGRVRARIGIHTGLVVIGEIGSEGRHETLALGSATNVAARIQAFADEGGVAISEATYALTIGVGASDLGRRRLKGLDETMRIYAVDHVGGSSRPLGRPAATPVFGRHEELVRLRECFEAARAGRGRTVLVGGEPGIGKSRLAAALRNDTAATARRWIGLACSPFATGTALQPLIALLEDRFSLRDASSGFARTQRVVAGLAQVEGLDLALVAPYLLQLLGLPDHAAFPLSTLAPEELRERTMAALCTLIDTIAARQTLVLAIEDLHWADPSTLQWIAQLTARAPSGRLLVLCTTRPGVPLPWADASVEFVSLSRLPADPTLELIASIAGERAISAELMRRIADRSDGVPLFVEQLTRAVLDADVPAEVVAMSAGPRAAAEPAIPATLRGLLMARLDRIGPAKRVAQLAAVLGREFDYELLADLGDLGEPTLRGGLARLVEADLITPAGTPPAVTYRFKHALVQEAAYESMLRTDRRAMHARVAAILEERFHGLVASEPAVLARHCAEAQLYDKAATLYVAAGRIAAARYANHEAMAHFRHALDAIAQLPDSEQRRQRELSVCLELAPPAIVCLKLDHPEINRLHARIAVLSSSATVGVPELPALLYLSRFYLRRGAVDRSAEVGESILRIARDAQIPLMEVVGRQIVGSCDILRAPVPTAIAHLERAVEVACAIALPPATSLREPDLLALLRATLSLALAIGGRLDEAAAQAEAARARASELGHVPTRALVLGFCTITLSFMSAFETAREWARETLALAEGRGFGTSEAQAHAMGGWARVALGDAGGVEEAEAGLAQAIEIGFRGGLCQTIQAVAEANRLAGRAERAHELIELGLKTHESTGETAAVGRLLRSRGLLYAAQGDAERAERDLRDALERLELYGARFEQLMAAADLLALARGRDDAPALRAQLEKISAQIDGGATLRPVRAAQDLLDATAPEPSARALRR